MDGGDVIRLATPFDRATAETLAAGQMVWLSGQVLTARDAAHGRLCALLAKGKALPVDVTDQVIYYVGPTPARPARVVGAAGPTTSSRMDAYAEALFAAGVRGTIGKGYRGAAAREALQRYGAVHFSAMGGLGALLSRHVKESRVLAYEDLGTEAIRQWTIEALPVIVAYDSHGGSVYGVEPK